MKEEENAVGRPAKYRKEYCQEIIDFFDVPHTIKTIKEKYTEKNGRETYEVIEANILPTFEKFAVKCGVHRSILLDWCDRYPEFHDAYKKAKDFQKDMLIDLGSRGYYSAAFTIFTAKNITDMKDKTEVENSGTVTTKTIYIEKDEKKKLEEHIDNIVND